MRVAYFLTHPIQYQSPFIRYLIQGGIDLQVIYASDASTRTHYDEGFGRQVEWDVPLLEGYSSMALNHDEPTGSRREQITHYRKQIRGVLTSGSYDAVWVHGWHHPFTVAAWLESKALELPLLLRAETFLGCVQGGWLKRLAHRLVFRRRFRHVDAFLAVGTLNHELYRSYGVPENRIFKVPYVVDNAFFQCRCREAAPHREALRSRLGIPPSQPIVLFCAKLIPVKDAATLIRAVGLTAQHLPDGQRPILLVAGDGALRTELEALAAKEATGQVRFLGFQNQTQLPALYDLCDVFVLSSTFEPWGLVVNEVMNAGKVVLVSDQIGSGPDLVKPGLNGDVFTSGNPADLCQKLLLWLKDGDLRERGGAESLNRINHWGFEECLQGIQKALKSLMRSTHD